MNVLSYSFSYFKMTCKKLNFKLKLYFANNFQIVLKVDIQGFGSQGIEISVTEVNVVTRTQERWQTAGRGCCRASLCLSHCFFLFFSGIFSLRVFLKNQLFKWMYYWRPL